MKKRCKQIHNEWDHSTVSLIQDYLSGPSEDLLTVINILRRSLCFCWKQFLLSNWTQMSFEISRYSSVQSADWISTNFSHKINGMLEGNTFLEMAWVRTFMPCLKSECIGKVFHNHGPPTSITLKFGETQNHLRSPRLDVVTSRMTKNHHLLRERPAGLQFEFLTLLLEDP